MAENFLPDFHPIVTHEAEGTCQCLVRDKAVRVTPEERVRQRVLHWLVHEKGWPKDSVRLERSYPWVSDSARTRIRSDIELLDDGNVVVVVECKRGDVPLDERVDQQAIEYAVKARARWIWTTNGKRHGFFEKQGSQWRPVASLKPLDVFSGPPVAKLEFPATIDAAALARYWKSLGDSQFLEPGANFDACFVLAMHRVLFDIPRKLPYSYGGAHILEDRGSAWHSFTNPGGGYSTRYADFIVATQGRVEAVSIAVNRWHRGGLRLCVGFRKPNRVHHALQLDTSQCVWDKEKKSWHIYHDGRMSHVSRDILMEAVREAQAGRWIDEDGQGRARIYLGVLPDVDSAKWCNVRDLLANLVHYAIIRTNLREARKR
ncbi:MAG: type I restriction enzyme HsdR N-terminal domain-containing protein [Thiotrichales bacterium]|nr:type I restriction enzyme HsdR N-terminal domain-containing protein [Thiotrichales bacterium]